MIRRGRGAGAGRAGPGPIHRGRSLSVAALHSRQLNDHRALCPRETCDAPSGSTLCWPDHRKRIFIRTLHHNRRRCSARLAPDPRQGRPASSRPALPVPYGRAPGHRQGRTGAPTGLYVPAPLMLSRPQAGGGSTGRARRPRCVQARAGCPRPRRPAATPSASAASYGWSRPRTAGDSGGAPPRVLEAQDPALSLGFTLPAAAPGGSTHLSPPG